MDTNITKTWTIDINEDEVFSRCTDETLYQAYNRAEANPKGDAVVIQDDDKGQFHIYFSVAIAELRMMLAHRMAESYGLGTTIVLEMHDNHDDNIMPLLNIHCYEYVVKRVLEQWYHASFGSEAEKLEIKHCLHYRKKPVRRSITPMC